MSVEVGEGRGREQGWSESVSLPPVRQSCMRVCAHAAERFDRLGHLLATQQRMIQRHHESSSFLSLSSSPFLCATSPAVFLSSPSSSLSSSCFMCSVLSSSVPVSSSTSSWSTSLAVSTSSIASLSVSSATTWPSMLFLLLFLFSLFACLDRSDSGWGGGGVQ